MKVTVAYTTQLKAALGKSEQTLSVETGATVQDAIEELAKVHADAFTQFVLSEGQLLPSILLSVNDRQVDATEPLADGDVITLLSAISGG